MKIFIASDHAGFKLKQHLIENSKLDLIDLGTDNAESCNYPIFANKLCNHVAKYNCSADTPSYGILICSTGVGMSIAANRHRTMRAALCFNEKMAELSRKHNNANVIVFGASIINEETALRCLRIFLETEFEKGHHADRLALIS